MSLPTSFSGMPAEEVQRSFRNICIEFKKIVNTSKNIDQLQTQMERFLGACKHVDWHVHTSGTYHQDEGVKAADRVWKEFKRYVLALLTGTASPHDLLAAITDIERLLATHKIT